MLFHDKLGVRVMVYNNMLRYGGIAFNATFNNISVMSLRSLLLVEENLLEVTDNYYHIKLYREHLTMSGIRTDNVSVDTFCRY